MRRQFLVIVAVLAYTQFSLLLVIGLRPVLHNVPYDIYWLLYPSTACVVAISAAIALEYDIRDWLSVPPQWHNWHVVWPTGFIIVLPIVAGGQYNANNLTVVVFAGNIVGAVAEEVLFRGIIFHSLVNRGVATAVLASSMLFGLSHWLLILQGDNVPTVVISMVMATAYGC